MRSKITNLVKTRNARLALAVLLSATLALPAHAAEIWKVNFAKSKFSSGSNTLVLERDSGRTTAQGIDAKGTAAGSSFLVISNGKLYMATDEGASNVDSSTGVRKVNYSLWSHMKLVQIGGNVQSADHCGFRCQGGLPENHMTLTFTANGIDPSGQMRDVLAVNK